MCVLVTGAAGFIGHHICARLLDMGREVAGVDDLNAYYSVALKEARIARLADRNGFTFHRMDMADHEALSALPVRDRVTAIIHVGAQAGVRHSLKDPFAYARANLVGHLSVLEFARHAPKLERTVYASSSSVYGANPALPWGEGASVDNPVSLYAATKRTDELMSASYASLYGLPQIGLRFFTVYGPWGRPDMAYWLFTERILKGEPIQLFNAGDMKRDFTFIDDVVEGVINVAFEPVELPSALPHRVYNIGNNRPVPLRDFVALLEAAIGRPAITVDAPMQPGDLHETSADITAIARDFGWRPTTPLEEGLPQFVAWYRDYFGV